MSTDDKASPAEGVVMPRGEWIVKQVADAVDVQQGRSDKPCFRINGPRGIEGVIWGWYASPKRALAAFVLEVYGIYPYSLVTERHFT